MNFGLNLNFETRVRIDNNSIVVPQSTEGIVALYSNLEAGFMLTRGLINSSAATCQR